RTHSTGTSSRHPSRLSREALRRSGYSCPDSSDQRLRNRGAVDANERSATTGGGHFSPIAAHDGRADALLVMDVARHKLSPFRVGTDLLWQAMATTDTRARGDIGVEVKEWSWSCGEQADDARWRLSGGSAATAPRGRKRSEKAVPAVGPHHL